MRKKLYMMLFVSLLTLVSLGTYAENYRWTFLGNQPGVADSPAALCEAVRGTPSYPIKWGGAGWYGCWGVCKGTDLSCFIAIGDECPIGTQINKTTGACENIDPPPPEPGIQFTPNDGCKSGVWDNKANSCVPTNTGCPDGQIKNEIGQCVPEPECPEGQTKNEKGQCVCPAGQAKGIDGICKPECPSGKVRNAATGLCEPECSSNTDTTGQCNPEGEADDGADPDPNKNCGNSAGNPILLATGQKVQTETDFSIAGSAVSLKRNYWSSRVEISSMGLGWQHNWKMQIQQLTFNNQVKLYRNNGSGLTFSPQANGQWLGPLGTDIAMISLPNKGWKVMEKGNIEIYNAKGQLISYDQQGYAPITLHYNDNEQLILVTDTAKNSLTITYNSKGLIAKVTSSQGLTIDYGYDEKYRLISITKNNKTITYHYENTLYPNALTGITDERGVRYVTWTYNEKGQAISSENAGGANKYQLEFLSNDRTRVINPLGGSTVYHFKNFLLKREIVKVEGEAVGSCIASNATYNRDYQGLILRQYDKNEGETAYEYNDRGLETKRSFNIQRPNYIKYTVTTKWHDVFHLPIEIDKQGWRTTFQYDDNGRLINKTIHSN